VCSEGLEIRADSAVVFSATNFSRLIGNVRFLDSGRLLTSDRANYFTTDGRLVAWGRARLEDQEDGTIITGDSMRFVRSSQFRPEDQLIVSGGRPRAVLYPPPPPPDTTPAAEAGDTLQVEAAGTDTLRAGEAPGDSVPPEVPPDTLRAGEPPDSMALDSLAARPDSLTPDSLAVGPDSLAPDSLAVRLDSLGLDTLGVAVLPQPEDTLAAPPDSLRLDTLMATPDSVAPQPPDSADLPPAGVTDTIPAPADTVRIPFNLEADRLYLEGQGYLRATGDVEVVRDSLEAFADSLEYRQDDGVLLLRKEASLISQGYSMTGREIDLLLPGGQLQEIQSRKDAVLLGTDLTLRAPQVRMYLVGGELNRLVAVDWATLGDSTEADPGEAAAAQEELPAETPEEAAADSVQAEPVDPRPVATARDFLLRADSIDVAAPGQVLDRLLAQGEARAESSARDSLNTPETPDLLRTDWIEGDTILAEFVRVDELGRELEPEDPGPPEVRLSLRRLTASGSARSLYRLDPQPADSVAGDSLVAGDTAAALDTVAVVALPGDSIVAEPPVDSLVAVAEGDSVAVQDPPTEPQRPQLPIHFVTGDRIIISMRSGEVERMEVQGQTRGLYLEPVIRRQRPPGGAVADGRESG
jgi:lipopolysaccharide export system protein LptA